MSDPSAALLPALKLAIGLDAGVVGAMAGKVKIYDVGPTDARKPYLILSGAQVTPTLADCFDLAEVEVSLDVWSLTNPPGQIEAMTIAAAVQAAMLGDLAVAGFTVSATPVRIAHLVDPQDGKTAHSVVVVRYAADPA